MHFFIYFVQKSFLTKNYFLIAEIILTTRGPLYTCLVIWVFFGTKQYRKFFESIFEISHLLIRGLIKGLKRDKQFLAFWTPGAPEGVLSNCPCPWSVHPSVHLSVRWSVFKYLSDSSLFFF